jgi:phenylpropionate dioxygenase-like ring-hydroxylating dioxygenase large terminal subunit
MVDVDVRHGLIWLALEDPIAPIPKLAEAENPGYRLIFSFDEHWSAAAPWIADNAIDIAHVNVVHAATIGDPDARRLAPYEVESTEHGFIARLGLSVSGVAAQSGGAGATTERSMEVEVLGPFITRVAIRYPGGTEHVLFIMASPIDDRSSRYIQLLARNDDEADAPAAELLALDRLVVAEDRAMCEALPVEFSTDPRSVVNVRADRITVEYRRYLAALSTTT